jgi:hypothetical protein
MARHNPTKRHMGFEKAAESAAASEGESLEQGKAIIAASTRKASAGAKKANPRLNRVKG